MSEIIKRIIDFKNNNTTKQLRKFYSTASLMEIYGINRKEIRHTSFLKWLFSPNCPVAKNAIGLFMDVLLSSKYFNPDNINKDLYNKLLLGIFNIDSFNSNENISVSGGEIDLSFEFTIEKFKIKIIVENKVYSLEHKSQTQRYYDSINEKYKDFTNFFVYLTPISTLELEDLNEPQCECKEYIQINYQILLDKIIVPLLKENIDSTTRYILEDYIMALSTPVNTNLIKNRYMAISTKESELLTMFWNENEDLILKAVEATKDNVHIEPEKREIAKKINALLNDSEEKIGAYVKRNLRQLSEENKITSDEVINLTNKEFSKNTFDINYGLLIKAENSSPTHYWKDQIKIGGVDYFMCCEWFEKNRGHFDVWLKKQK